MSRMLSRFSKLPGIASLLSRDTYPKEAVDYAVSQIKTLGHSAMTSDESVHDIECILSLMNRYAESLNVQRVACHALSNLAMQVLPARWIIQKNGFSLIKKCLTRFSSDYKLCWLASSAVWNLARPPANRSVIGVDGVTLMFQVLNEHYTCEKVVNTAVGALSNLSLCEELKDFISTSENITLIHDILKHYSSSSSVSVMTSGAGLVANLAVSDNHANSIVKHNMVPLLLNALQWKVDTEEVTLFRNVCAALNNLVTADEFLPELLLCRGVEQLYIFLRGSDNHIFQNLLENCLITMDADPALPTTSMHVAAIHGHLEVLRTLIKDDPSASLDIVDGNNLTCLDYAVVQQHTDVIEFLTLCGASVYSSETNTDISTEVHDALHRGSSALKDVNELYFKTAEIALKQFPVELCHLMVQHVSTIDKLVGVELF